MMLLMSHQQHHQKWKGPTIITPPTIITLTLPYAGYKGETIINKMRKHINKTIPNTNATKIQIIYNTKKLGSKFKIKDQTKKEHQHNVVYHAKCPDPQCNSNYIGQTKCRLLKRVIQHNKQDKNSNLLIHSNDKSHHRVWLDDFEIFDFRQLFRNPIRRLWLSNFCRNFLYCKKIFQQPFLFSSRVKSLKGKNIVASKTWLKVWPTIFCILKQYISTINCHPIKI